MGRRSNDVAPLGTRRPHREHVARFYRALDVGVGRGGDRGASADRTLGVLTLDVAEELTRATARAFFEEPAVRAAVAGAFCYSATAGGRPGPLVADGATFRLRWPVPDHDVAYSALEAFNVLLTDLATLLARVAQLSRERYQGDLPDEFRSGARLDRDKLTKAVLDAWREPVEPVHQSEDFARLVAHRLIKLWEASPGPSEPCDRYLFPRDHWQWLGMYLVSVEWRDRIRNAASLRRRPSEDLVCMLAMAKRGLCGMQRTTLPRQARQYAVGWQTVEKALREATPEKMLNWRVAQGLGDLDEPLMRALRRTVATPGIAELLRREGVHSVLGTDVTVTEGDADDAVSTIVLPRVSAEAERVVPSPSDVAPPDHVEHPAAGGDRTEQGPPGSSTTRDHLHTRVAGLCWSSGEVAWRERGRTAALEWLRLVRSATVPSAETARMHLEERREIALALTPGFAVYLRRALVFPLVPMLIVTGVTAATRLALMTPLVEPVPESLARAIGVVPMIALLLANLSWSRARSLRAGLTPTALAAAASALPVGFLRPVPLMVVAGSPLVAAALVWWLRTPWRPREGRWLGSRGELDRVRSWRANPSRIINTRLERATTTLGSGALAAVPLPVTLLIDPRAFAQQHPALQQLADDVVGAEYAAYAKYRRWAEAVPYCRISRQPLADFALRHAGTPGIAVDHFATPPGASAVLRPLPKQRSAVSRSAARTPTR